jgi:hypothetical protein
MFLTYITTAGSNVNMSVRTNVTGNLFVVIMKLHDIDARGVPFRNYKDSAFRAKRSLAMEVLCMVGQSTMALFRKHFCSTAKWGVGGR